MTSFVDIQRFSNAQTAARVFILSNKHIGMVSLSYFENSNFDFGNSILGKSGWTL